MLRVPHTGVPTNRSSFVGWTQARFWIEWGKNFPDIAFEIIDRWPTQARFWLEWGKNFPDMAFELLAFGKIKIEA